MQYSITHLSLGARCELIEVPLTNGIIDYEDIRILWRFGENEQKKKRKLMHALNNQQRSLCKDHGNGIRNVAEHLKILQH